MKISMCLATTWGCLLLLLWGSSLSAEDSILVEDRSVQEVVLGGSIIRVNVNAPSGERGPCPEGTCWAFPFTNLRDAIEAASSGDEIWVAAGVYLPDVGLGAVDNNPPESFLIPAGVSLFGGFNGSEVLRDQRDPELNPTILSGDIDSNDADSDGDGIVETTADIVGVNAYNVVTTQGAEGVVLDGFTITAGSAFGILADQRRGGAINCGSDTKSANVFNDLVFIGNRALGNGGAMSRCNATISDSTFRNNTANGNGGGADFTRNANLTDVRFFGNSAGASGGAFRTEIQVEVDRGEFRGNQAALDGGAVFSELIARIDNSLFSGNVAGGNGGGLVLGTNAFSELTNVTLTGNRAALTGAAIYVPSFFNLRGIPVRIFNSVIWNNEDQNGVGTVSALTSVDPVVVVGDSLFQGSGGSSNWNPAAGIDDGDNIDTDPLLEAEVDLLTLPSLLGNARPSNDSPIIDAGSNFLVGTDRDLDGFDRIIGTAVDMGAYESQGILFRDRFEAQP